MFNEVIFIRQEEPLTQTIVATVEQMVDGLKTEIAHGMVVGVRVYQRHRQPSSAPGVGTGAGFGCEALAGFVVKLARHAISLQ